MLTESQLDAIADWADRHDDAPLWMAAASYYLAAASRELVDQAWHDLGLGNPHRGEEE